MRRNRRQDERQLQQNGQAGHVEGVLYKDQVEGVLHKDKRDEQ